MTGAAFMGTCCGATTRPNPETLSSHHRPRPEKKMLEVETGDVGKMYDWPEVTSVVFGERKRAQFTGKVKALSESPKYGACVEVWAEPPDAKYGVGWTKMRTLPLEFVIRVESAKMREAASLSERLD